MDADQVQEDSILRLDRESAVYTSCYCEENVWKLCRHIQENALKQLSGCFAVFISNDSQKVPLWRQKAGSSVDGAAVWDYHVILIHQATHESWVFDLDTTLSFPCDFKIYACQAIRSEECLDPIYRRLFRVIGAETFLNTFASDRSHMIKKDNTWLSPPPCYPCISTSESANNLSEFISMDPGIGVGTIMTCNQLIEKFQL